MPTAKCVTDNLCTLLGQTKLKKSFWSSCLVNFLPSENTQTDRQIITKRRYDRKYIHMQTVMLLNMYKNLENY